MKRGNGCLEVLDIAVRDRLMGFDEGYTLGAMASSAAKAQPGEEFAIRASLRGNAIDVKVAAWALSHLAFDLGYLERVPTRAEIWNGKCRRLVVATGPRQAAQAESMLASTRRSSSWWPCS